jgi:hypothetical protein
VLSRRTYLGELVYGQTRKRNTWGQRKYLSAGPKVSGCACLNPRGASSAIQNGKLRIDD